MSGEWERTCRRTRQSTHSGVNWSAHSPVGTTASCHLCAQRSRAHSHGTSPWHGESMPGTIWPCPGASFNTSKCLRVVAVQRHEVKAVGVATESVGAPSPTTENRRVRWPSETPQFEHRRDRAGPRLFPGRFQQPGGRHCGCRTRQSLCDRAAAGESMLGLEDPILPRPIVSALGSEAIKPVNR